ncbi:hypothetical protein BN1708_018536, partial [Verticillium longisporum]
RCDHRPAERARSPFHAAQGGRCQNLCPRGNPVQPRRRGHGARRRRAAPSAQRGDHLARPGIRDHERAEQLDRRGAQHAGAARPLRRRLPRALRFRRPQPRPPSPAVPAGGHQDTRDAGVARGEEPRHLDGQRRPAETARPHRRGLATCRERVQRRGQVGEHHALGVPREPCWQQGRPRRALTARGRCRHIGCCPGAGGRGGRQERRPEAGRPGEEEPEDAESRHGSRRQRRSRQDRNYEKGSQG